MDARWNARAGDYFMYKNESRIWNNVFSMEISFLRKPGLKICQIRVRLVNLRYFRSNFLENVAPSNLSLLIYRWDLWENFLRNIRRSNQWSVQAWTWLELLRGQRSVQRESGITKCNVPPALYLCFSSGFTRKLLFSSFNSQIDFQQLRHSFTIVTPAPFNKAVKENGKRQSPRWIYLRLNRTKHVNRAAFQRRITETDDFVLLTSSSITFF